MGTYARVLKEEHNILIGRKMGLREYNQVQANAWSVVSGNIAAVACNLRPAAWVTLLAKRLEPARAGKGLLAGHAGKRLLAGHCTWGSQLSLLLAQLCTACSSSFWMQDLSVGLLTNMYKDKTDFTTTFRSLASVSADDEANSIPAPLAKVCSTSACASRLCET